MTRKEQTINAKQTIQWKQTTPYCEILYSYIFICLLMDFGVALTLHFPCFSQRGMCALALRATTV